MSTRRLRLHALVVLLLCFFAFAASALISRLVFERLPHLEDEYAYTFEARTLARGDMVIPSPPTRRAYWQPFVIDRDGLRFGKYPPGWALLLAFGTLAGQEWVVNALLSALTVALVYAIGCDLFGRGRYGRDVGLIGAALAAFSPMALLLDATLMAHTSALFLGTLTLWAYLRLEKAIEAKTHALRAAPALWAVTCGAALGLLTANRPITGVAFALPLVMRGLALGIERVRGGGGDRGSKGLSTYSAEHVEGRTPPSAKASRLSQGRKPRERGSLRLSGLPPLPQPSRFIPWRSNQAESFAQSDTPLKPPALKNSESPLKQAQEGNDVVGDPSDLTPRPPLHLDGEGEKRWRERGGGLVRAWLVPHLIVSVVALAVFSIMPIYNQAATGSPTTDLYTFIWSYDRVGFGDCCGRHGHTLAKGFLQTRFDLSLTAADLFGWQWGLLTDDSRAHLANDSDYYPQIGISWLLLPFGILIGLGQRWWLAAIWAAGIVGAYALALQVNGGVLLNDPTFGWAWVIGALAWTLLPILFLRDRRMSWTWILFTTAALLIGLQLAYWIGSQRYSTRYYFEGLTGAALLSAIPVAMLLKSIETQARKPPETPALPWLRVNPARALVYGGAAAVLLWSLFAYSLPRIEVLKGYNLVTHDLLDQVAARREAGKDVLVIVTGADVRWRAYGALMASTSPYLDSPIVAAWDYSNGTDPTVRQGILDRFPDRQVIDMIGDVNQAWFADSPRPAS